VTGGPSRGLPPRTYLPILVVTALAFLGIVGYFLKVGLAQTGTALGPIAQQGDANIRASAPPEASALPTSAPGEVVVPQSGGAPGSAAGGGNGALGGSPSQGVAGGPPAPVQRLLEELRERLQRNPSDLAALVNLANLYFDAGKYPQAIAYYRRALALDPANPDTRTDYATALHGSGRDLEALRELENVLAKRPKFPEALFNQGVVANAIGRRTEAIEAFRTFLRVAPNDQRASDARTALQNLGA
jgi:TolA-binding protein